MKKTTQYFSKLWDKKALFVESFIGKKSRELFDKQEEKMKVSTIEKISLEVANAFFAESEQEELQSKILQMKERIEEEMGLTLPIIHLTTFSSYQKKYQIKLKEIVVTEGLLEDEKLLAVKDQHTFEDIVGELTEGITFVKDSYWIKEEVKDKALFSGYQVFEKNDIIIFHLENVLRKHLHQLLDRQVTQNLLNALGKKHDVLLKEIETYNVSLSLIQKVLQKLLQEQITIKDLSFVIEMILDAKEYSNSLEDICSYVREKMGAVICERLASKEGKVLTFCFAKELEESLEKKLVKRLHEYYLTIEYELAENIIHELNVQMGKFKLTNTDPILIVRNPSLRFALVKLIQRYDMSLTIICANEVVPGYQFEILSEVAVKKALV